MPRIAIIGAGITGLTAAYAFKQKQIPFDLIEKSNIPGGVIQTLHEENLSIELGPHTLLLNDIRIVNFLDEIGLNKDIIDNHPDAKKRFIVKNSKLIPLPHSLPSFITTPLFSAKAKLKLLKEPFIKKSYSSNETVAQFIERRLGHEPLEYAVDPFVSGVYAGDSHKLSIKHAFPRIYNLENQYGSLVKGLISKKRNPNKIKARSISFIKGMATLPLKLAELVKSSLYLNSKILSIRQSNNEWEITWESNGKTYKNHYQKLIITIPSYRLFDLPLEPQLVKMLLLLKDINFAPIASVTQTFKRESITHPLDGFGMLIPSKESFKILGTLFVSSMFPQPNSKHLVTLRTFIGGNRCLNIDTMNKNTIENLALNDIAILLGIKDSPIYSNVNIEKFAIPQYNLGYETFLNRIEDIETMFRGLHIIGNYRNGISLPDCILAGLHATEFLNLSFG